MFFRRMHARLDTIEDRLGYIEADQQTLIIQGKKIMAQNDDLLASVAALATASSAAEASIAAELATIASQTGSNPVVAQAITNINAITAGLTAAAASVPPVPPTS